MATSSTRPRTRYVEEFEKASRGGGGGEVTVGYGLQTYDSVLGSARTAVEKLKKMVYSKPRAPETASLVRVAVEEPTALPDFDVLDAEILGTKERDARKNLSIPQPSSQPLPRSDQQGPVSSSAPSVTGRRQNRASMAAEDENDDANSDALDELLNDTGLSGPGDFGISNDLVSKRSFSRSGMDFNSSPLSMHGGSPLKSPGAKNALPEDDVYSPDLDLKHTEDFALPGSEFNRVRRASCAPEIFHRLKAAAQGEQAIKKALSRRSTCLSYSGLLPGTESCPNSPLMFAIDKSKQGAVPASPGPRAKRTNSEYSLPSPPVFQGTELTEADMRGIGPPVSFKSVSRVATAAGKLRSSTSLSGAAGEDIGRGRDESPSKGVQIKGFTGTGGGQGVDYKVLDRLPVTNRARRESIGGPKALSTSVTMKERSSAGQPGALKPSSSTPSWLQSAANPPAPADASRVSLSSKSDVAAKARSEALGAQVISKASSSKFALPSMSQRAATIF